MHLKLNIRIIFFYCYFLRFLLVSHHGNLIIKINHLSCLLIYSETYVFRLSVFNFLWSHSNATYTIIQVPWKL